MAGWRWIFLLNIPIALLALITLPPLMRNRWTRDIPSHPVNVLGAVLLTSGLFALLYGLTRSKEDGMTSLPVMAIVTGGMILLAAFAIIDRRSAAPLIPSDLLRSRALIGSMVVAFALTAATGSAGVLLTMFMQTELGLSPSKAGVMLAPFSIAVVLGSMAGAHCTDRFGFRASMSLGLAGVTVAMLIEVSGVAAVSLPLLVAGFSLSGVALGCASVASTAGGLSATEEGRRGLASGLLSSSAKTGTALGIALIPTMGAVWIGAGSLAGAPTSSNLMTGFQIAFVTAAIVAVLAIPVAWSSFPGRDSSRDDGVVNKRPNARPPAA
jgi:MFS family permease